MVHNPRIANASPPLLRTRRGLMFTAFPAIAVMAVLGTVLAVTHRDSSVRDRRAESAQIALAAATNAARFVDDRFATLAAVAAAPVPRPALRRYLKTVARSSSFSSGMAFVDRRGLAVVSSTLPPGLSPTDVGDRAYVKEALAGRRAVSDVLIGRVRSRPLIAFSQPAPGGLVVGSLALDQFDEALQRLLFAPDSGETIVDTKDNVIVGEAAVRGLQQPDPAFPLERMRRRGRGTLKDVEAKGGTRLLAYARVPDTGWLVIVDRRQDEVLGPLDRALWLEIAALALLAGVGVLLTLASARRLDRLDRARDEALSEQRQIAVELQDSLLPELPHMEGLTVEAGYTAAQGAMSVGGDWYDAVEIDDRRVGLSVGDVAGHGLQAAATMGKLRSAVRTLALDGAEPADALERLDRFNGVLEGQPLATVLYAVLDRTTGELRYAAAGHPPPLVLGAGGATRLLEDGRSPLLGVDPLEPRPEGFERLAPGETLIVFTDGLIERPDSSIDAGIDRLAALAGRGYGNTAALTAALLGSVDEPRRDDAAVLCVRFEGAPQPSSVPS